jgi:hypothetical protein
MAGTTDGITDERWIGSFMLRFVLIDGAIRHSNGSTVAATRLGPILHDREVITVALIANTWFHGHQALALSVLGHDHSDLFSHVPASGYCSACRSVPGPLIDQIRRVLTNSWGLIDPDERDRLVDRAPIPLQRTRAPARTKPWPGRHTSAS